MDPSVHPKATAYQGTCLPPTKAKGCNRGPYQYNLLLVLHPALIHQKEKRQFLREIQ